MLIDHTTNGHLFTDHAITQKPFDYSAVTKQQAECSVCKRRGDKDAMILTYATPLEQSMKRATLAHKACHESRKEAIANYRRAK